MCTLYHVIIGSGMGLKSSGGISDYAFFVLAESEFMLNPSVRDQFGIRAYFRFKDDLLVILDGREGNVRFFLGAPY